MTGPLPHTLVTGGAGFIGSHLVERLLADGHRVTIIDDLSTGRTENLQEVAGHGQLTFIRARVSEIADLDALVGSAHSIFHLAATVGVELVLKKTAASILNNFRESEAILAAAARLQVPVLLASSSEVYGRSGKDTLSEDDELILGPPAVGRWSYACSKLMVEFLALALARERGLPVVIARIFNTVGPRQVGRYGMVLPRFIEAAQTGQPLRVHGDGRQSRCFCWVHDTVESLVRLQTAPAARGLVVNVGNDEPVEILELANLIRRRCASTSEIQFVPHAKAYGEGFEDFGRRRPDLSRLSRLAGFRPSTGLEEIVDRLVSPRTR